MLLNNEKMTYVNPWGIRLSTTYQKNIGFDDAPVMMVRIDPETNIPHGYFIPPGKKVIDVEPSEAVQAAIMRNLKVNVNRSKVCTTFCNIVPKSNIMIPNFMISRVLDAEKKIQIKIIQCQKRPVSQIIMKSLQLQKPLMKMVHVRNC